MRQRANRKLKRKEELLDKKNGHGVTDLTAYNAVKQIVTQGKATLVLRQPPEDWWYFCTQKIGNGGKYDGENDYERTGTCSTDGNNSS